ncbi:MAG TPA: peptidoglycan DD-metalloendopeptidase family protein [Acidimicrobiia bacterium]|nr:peptidoglycan DD-metalloendopeptidase family protein [Acidimicrobiia bacterium]
MEDARAAVARSEQEVAEAQRAANAAADDYQQTLSEQAGVEAAVKATGQSIQGFEARYEALRKVASERAVAAYVRGGSVPSFLFDADDVMDVARSSKYAGWAAARDQVLMEQANDAREALEARRRELEDERDRLAQLVSRARSQIGQVTARLETARASQARLADELRRAEGAAAAEAAKAATQRRAAAAPAAPAARPPSSPPDLPVPVGTVVGGLACPIAGPRAFSNDWMASRPGGTRHEGTDIFSPRGTPNVAVVSGTITQKYGSRQGNGVHLNGDDGTLYYYFHLQSYAGGPRRVSQGEVIGYTGDSGSPGAVHTHFEIHPGRGGAVNPYPTLQRVC